MGVALLLLVSFASCNTTKYLAPEQELLTRQQVNLLDPKNVNGRADASYELSTLALQRPNTNFLLLWPREYFYLDNNKPKDTTNIDNFLRQTIGQAPAIYSDSLSRRSATRMQDYMRYKGYFNAQAYHEADRSAPQKVNLIYHVRAGRRYLIDSVLFNSPDPGIDSLLQAGAAGSVLQAGDPLDLNNFDAEKGRIGELLRNSGYAFFSGAYIDQLEVDTSRRAGYADVVINILPAANRGIYDQYRIGNITVFTDYDPVAVRQGNYALDTIIDGVRFLSNRGKFRMRPDLLRENIYLESGKLTDRADLAKTNRSLNELGLYRFVRINQQVDSTRENVLDYAIQLSPGNKMSVGADLEVNYTNRNGTAGAGNLIGFAVEPSFQSRNVFGGAELLTTSIRAGVEVNPSPSRNDRLPNSVNPFFNTIDLAADVTLNLPRFRDFGLYSFLNKLPAPYTGKLIGDATLAGLRDRASTRYSIGYEYLLIRQLFSYTIFNARLGYDYRASPTTSYRINHLTIDILDPSIEPAFQAVLEDNQRLARSFGEQYFFSLLFRSLEYNRAGRVDRRGRSLSYTGNLEIAGAEIFGLNQLIDVFSEEETDLKPTANAEFAKYARLQNSLRYNKQYTPQTSFAARLVLEVGHPFGGIEDELPYVKQFFVGGANSMRGWAPRGLGPGGYVDTASLNTNNNLFLYQTGDLRLEFNAEYRFPLFSFFRGALFLDAGNVWTLEPDGDRPGSQFRFREQLLDDILVQPFYRQIAINAGLGFRVDLSYFIFRLDFAIPLRFNYPDSDLTDDEITRGPGRPPERAYWTTFQRFGFRNVRPQLGLGYPF